MVKKRLLPLFLLLLALPGVAIEFPFMIGEIRSEYAKNVAGIRELTPTPIRLDTVFSGNNIEVAASGPIGITFYGMATKPLVGTKEYSWEVKLGDSRLYSRTYRFTKEDTQTGALVTDDFSYLFDKGSTDQKLVYTIRLIMDEETEQTGLYKITIYASKLEVPNVFTPNGDGHNDEFRVSFRSLKRFSAQVFNRWGVEMFRWTDPARGWDGTYNGKQAHNGAYFYVIEAEGTDGQVFKLKGDINLFR